MSCISGKIRYRSQLDARLALLRCKKNAQRRHAGRHECAVYRCPHCFG